VVALCEQFGVSERRACRVVDLHRSTQRLDPPIVAEGEQRLREWLRTFSKHRPRWGWRRAAKQARREGWLVNDKRIQRLWRDEGLKVAYRKRKKPHRGTGTAVGAMCGNVNSNALWAMDFQFDTTADRRMPWPAPRRSSRRGLLPAAGLDPVRVLEDRDCACAGTKWSAAGGATRPPVQPGCAADGGVRALNGSSLLLSLLLNSSGPGRNDPSGAERQACDQDFCGGTGLQRRPLPLSQRRSRRFESAHLHSSSLNRRYMAAPASAQ
jgi:hypothetical protein